MPADIIISFFKATSVFIFLAFISGLAASKPVYVAWLILCLILLDASNMSLAFNYGILLYPEDILFFIISISCLIRLSLFVSPKTVPGAWWIIGAVQSIIFVWGLLTFGTAAGVDYRGHFYLWVVIVYFCSIKWTETMIKSVVNAWLVCSISLCLLVYYRWIGSAIDPIYAKELSILDPAGGGFRVVSSGSALVIAIGFLIISFKMTTEKFNLLHRILLPILFFTVVVLQHRSVWVSLIIGFTCLLWTLKRKNKKIQSMIGIVLIVVSLVFTFAIFGKGNEVFDSVVNSADQAVSTEEGTMVARVGNWQGLLIKWIDSKNIATYIIGNPYGSGYNPVESEDGKITFDMVPHNHLMHILYRGGLIGLLATLYIFYQVFKNGVEEIRSTDKLWAPFFLAVFAALFSYYIPYWATYAHGMIIGIAISYFRIDRIQGVSLSQNRFFPVSS